MPHYLFTASHCAHYCNAHRQGSNIISVMELGLLHWDALHNVTATRHDLPARKYSAWLSQRSDEWINIWIKNLQTLVIRPSCYQGMHQLATSDLGFADKHTLPLLFRSSRGCKTAFFFFFVPFIISFYEPSINNSLRSGEKEKKK